VKALGDAVHEELGTWSGAGIALKFTKKLGMRWVILWPRRERGSFAGAEQRIAYSFILHEGTEAFAKEKNAGV
jgi:hypothetical protein